MPQHRLADFIVGNDAGTDRLDNGDRIGRPAEHLLGKMADGAPAGENLAGFWVDRGDGRLIEHKAFAGRADPRVGGPKVDGQVDSKLSEQL